MDAEQEIDALKARVDELERITRFALAFLEEQGRAEAVVARASKRPATSEEWAATERREDAVFVRAVLRPIAESLPVEARAEAFKMTPEAVLRELAGAPKFGAEARRTMAEMADVAAKHALTWTDLEMVP